VHARFLSQPFAGDANLHDFIARVVENQSLRSLNVVVAWAKKSGLRHVERYLRDFRRGGGHSSIIVGIDEGGATRQGLEMARELFDKVHVLHDRSGRTFHPKIYLAQGEGSAELLVGSNNLTGGGIFYNYEAGLDCTLDLGRSEDVELLDAVIGYVERLRDDRETCIELSDQFFEQLIAGARYRIRDEDSLRRPHNEDDPENIDTEVDAPDKGPLGDGAASETALFGKSREPKRGASSLRGRISTAPSPTGPSRGAGPMVPPPVGTDEASVVKRWFKRLSATDAQRPPGPRSNPTGNLHLVKARHPIDHTTYFRRDFFGPLPWKSRTGSMGPIDETYSPFHVFIDGVDQGVHDLKVQDKPSGEAGQHNYTSGLHWGPLVPTLASRDYSGHYVILEKLADGSYRLVITPENPGAEAFIP
jgi:hypothetical protein